MRYSDEELQLLRELAATHGQKGVTWTSIGLAFVRRYPNHPVTGAVEKAKTVRWQARDLQPQRLRSVSVAHLLRLRKMATDLVHEIDVVLEMGDHGDDGE